MADFAIDRRLLEQLLNNCFGFAKMMLEKHGEFYPFGGTIDSSGAAASVGGHIGEEHPRGSELYLFLENALRAQFAENKIIAAALAANVNIPPTYSPPFPDGIRVLLECEGFSRYVYLPYRIWQSGVDYADFISVDVPPTICIRNTS